MLLKRENIIMQKMLIEIGDIENSITGLNHDAFIATVDKKKSVAMSLINLGELVRHLPKGFIESHPSIAFRKILDLRNKTAHGYYTLDFSFVWGTVTERIPELKRNIEDILRKL